MPISPLAKPRPSTTATITEAPEIMDPDELLVPVEKGITLNEKCRNWNKWVWSFSFQTLMTVQDLWARQTLEFFWIVVFHWSEERSCLRWTGGLMVASSQPWSCCDTDLHTNCYSEAKINIKQIFGLTTTTIRTKLEMDGILKSLMLVFSLICHIN